MMQADRNDDDGSSVKAINRALATAVSQVSSQRQKCQQQQPPPPPLQSFSSSKFKLVESRKDCVSTVGGTSSISCVDEQLCLVPRLILPGTAASQLLPLCRLTNAAYKDARWFKKPHFHDRVSLESVQEYIAKTPKQGFFIGFYLDRTSFLRLGIPKLDYMMDMEKLGDDIMDQFAEKDVLISSCYIRRWLSPDSPPLVSLVSVDPLIQKSGIGSLMLDLVFKLVILIDSDRVAAFKTSKQDEAMSETGKNLHQLSQLSLQLEVVDVQQHLLKFYKKIGFHETGVRLSWEDVGFSRADVTTDCCLVVMEKLLS